MFNDICLKPIPAMSVRKINLLPVSERQTTNMQMTFNETTLRGLSSAWLTTASHILLSQTVWWPRRTLMLCQKTFFFFFGSKILKTGTQNVFFLLNWNFWNLYQSVECNMSLRNLLVEEYLKAKDGRIKILPPKSMY